MNVGSKEKRKGKERKGKERKGKERKGKERKGKERKGKERKGKERKEKKRPRLSALINEKPSIKPGCPEGSKDVNQLNMHSLLLVG